MKLDEYLESRFKIEKESASRLRQLAYDFALSNNTVSVGDLVEDHIGKLKVEKIKLWYRLEHPSLCYFGTRYTKSGKPFKSGEKREVFKTNMK